MNNPDKNTSPPPDIETFLNGLLQRLFPVWYAAHAAREIALQPMGVLNPNSFLGHRWLSLHAVVKSLRESMLSQGDEWKPLGDLLEKLLTERELQRPMSISAIDGIEHSTQEDDWPNIISWAEHVAADIPHDSADDFDQLVHQAFPDANKPHRIVYREWDGRYYWINNDDPTSFAAARLYSRDKHRDATISASINIESINTKILDRIHQDYWLLLMSRESAYPVHNLIIRAELTAVLAEFEWRRGDLIFIVARKNNRKLNQIMLNLLNNRSSQQILELGLWLGRRHFPFRNH